MSGIHLLPPLSKYYGTFCHQVVSIIVQEFIYYLPCPNIMERFAIRWCLSFFRNSFITSPVQRPCNLLPSGDVCHCSGIHLLPPLSKYYGMFCHQVVSVIIQEFIYYLPCPKTMQPFAIRWCLSLFSNSFITSPVQRLCNLLPSGGVCHCSGIHLLPPLSKDHATFCHQVVSVIVQ
jgi:hypothetical protein